MARLRKECCRVIMLYAATEIHRKLCTYIYSIATRRNIFIRHQALTYARRGVVAVHFLPVAVHFLPESKYRIRGIIGESNIWQFTLKMQLARFLIGGFEFCVERNPC